MKLNRNYFISIIIPMIDEINSLNKTLKILNKNKDSSAVNLSTGKFTDFITLAKIALEICGKTNKPEGGVCKSRLHKDAKKIWI